MSVLLLADLHDVGQVEVGRLPRVSQSWPRAPDALRVLSGNTASLVWGVETRVLLRIVVKLLIRVIKSKIV